MKTIVRSLMVVVFITTGLALVYRSTSVAGGSGGERWIGPTINVGKLSIGVGLKVARASDGRSVSDSSQTGSECSGSGGNVIIVKMPDRVVAVEGFPVDGSREE